MAGYEADGLTPAVHRGLPSDTLTMVFSLDEPLRTAPTWHDWRLGRWSSQWTVLGGLHTTATFVDQPGRWCGVQVALHPLGARRLFGLPAAAMPVTSWNAHDLLGSPLEAAHERLARVTTWRHRYAVITDLLMSQLAADHDGRVKPEVSQAWRCLTRTQGRMRIADLARHVGYSRRRLADLFHAETGLSPKTAARLVRFDAAQRALALRSARGEPLHISGLATMHGYYDHAHLVRDFTEFAGLGPTSWLREEFPNVQAGSAAHATS
ncbi:MAG: helix-turn-helix domain-containing protein [Ornithinimicrobium sp.]